MKICNLGIAFQKNITYTYTRVHVTFMSWAKPYSIFLSKTWLKIEFQDPRPVKKLLAKHNKVKEHVATA